MATTYNCAAMLRMRTALFHGALADCLTQACWTSFAAIFAMYICPHWSHSG
jgi:hypothetical protein